jgi:hypothetical protein
MILKDDRTEAEKETHNYGITAIDKFMSGWGGSAGGNSRATWACKKEDWHKVIDWVESRAEMKYVNLVKLDSYRARNTAHHHIYVVNDGHPSLR